MFLFSEQIHIYRNAYPSRIKTSVPNGSNIDLIDIQWHYGIPPPQFLSSKVSTYKNLYMIEFSILHFIIQVNEVLFIMKWHILIKYFLEYEKI